MNPNPTKMKKYIKRINTNIPYAIISDLSFSFWLITENNIYKIKNIEKITHNLNFAKKHQ